MHRIAYLLSLLLVFTIPWENAVTIGDWGTLTRAIGAAAAVSWILSAVLSRRIRRPHLFHVFLFLFLLWNLASLFWSESIDDTIQRILTYVQLTALAWILWDLYDTPAALRSALVAYILGAYVSLGSLISNYITGTELGEFAGQQIGCVKNRINLQQENITVWSSLGEPQLTKDLLDLFNTNSSLLLPVTNKVASAKP